MSSITNMTNTTEAGVIKYKEVTEYREVNEYTTYSPLNSSDSSDINVTMYDNTTEAWPRFREVVLHSGDGHDRCSARTDDESIRCPSCLKSVATDPQGELSI